MSAKNKLLNAVLILVLTFAGFGMIFNPAEVHAAVQDCTPGYQESFDTDNGTWQEAAGNTEVANGGMVIHHTNTGSMGEVSTVDLLSGDFEVEVEITNITGFDKSTDNLYFWLQASLNAGTYFNILVLSDSVNHSVQARKSVDETLTTGDTVVLGPTFNLPITLKLVREGSTMYAYYMMDNTYYFVDTMTDVTTEDVDVILASSMATSVGHQIDVKFDNFRIGCILPTLGEFEMNGGLTSTPISSVVFDNKMHQFVGGNTYPNKIYMRATNDGEYDGSHSMESWITQLGAGGPGGETATEVGTAVFNNRLYIAVKGRDTGQIFTKSTDTLYNWDSTWNENGGKSGTAIAMATFNPGSGDRLYQVIRGFSTNNLYYRYTEDGTFDGNPTSENWTPIMNQGNIATSPNAPAIEVYNGRLYISVRGSSGNINYASTSDGEFDSDASDEYFILSGGKTSVTPSMEVHDGNLYQSIKGNSTDLIYTRYFTTLDGWSGWYEYGGKTTSRVDLTYFDGGLFQTVRGNSGNIFMRKAFAFTQFI